MWPFLVLQIVVSTPGQKASHALSRAWKPQQGEAASRGGELRRMQRAAGRTAKIEGRQPLDVQRTAALILCVGRAPRVHARTQSRTTVAQGQVATQQSSSMTTANDAHTNTDTHTHTHTHTHTSNIHTYTRLKHTHTHIKNKHMHWQQRNIGRCYLTTTLLTPERQSKRPALRCTTAAALKLRRTSR
jgi:hypothetical protein